MNHAAAISIVRTTRQENQILGQLLALDANGQELFRCVTLELPWRENARRISCIPPGRYTLRPRYSEKYRHHLHVLDVPNRDWILIHEANYVHQLQGCIAIGRTVADINADGTLDITSSKLTKNRLMEFIDGDLELIIS